MEDKPLVRPGEWIRIGTIGIVNAVVCAVFKDSPLGDCEVVFLDERDQAINRDVHWVDTRWEFVYPNPDGGYADNIPRLQRYIAILRAGSGQKIRPPRGKNPSSRIYRRR